jgi:hypothetical protein
MPTELNILELQERILQGHTLTAEEYKQIIDSHRAGRTAAAATSAKSRSKKAPVDFDLNAEIDAALGL